MEKVSGLLNRYWSGTALGTKGWGVSLPVLLKIPAGTREIGALPLRVNIPLEGIQTDM